MWNAVVLVLLHCLCVCVVTNDVTVLTTDNIDSTLLEHQFVFVVFGADWCPFSRQLQPIFAEAASVFKENHPSSDVVWASVDCMVEQYICERYFVSKYPTMKVFIHGDMMTAEYRARRAVEDLIHFVANQYSGSIREFKDDTDLAINMNTSTRNVVAYIPRGDEIYKNLYNIAQLLREYCTIWVPSENVAEKLTKYRMYYKAPGEPNSLDYIGDFQNYTLLKQWITDKCIPVVREVTFENVEGITEEGLPLLIYFRDPQKKEDDKLFTDVVIRELYEQRMSVNPLLADGYVFAHPLHRLQKTIHDLPVLAIDSFTHIYLFPDMSRLSEPGMLKKFVDDLHSGSLHRRYHQTEEQFREELEIFKKANNLQDDLEDRREQEGSVEINTAVPESVFKELKPSGKRYSILQKTEL